MFFRCLPITFCVYILMDSCTSIYIREKELRRQRDVPQLGIRDKNNNKIRLKRQQFNWEIIPSYSIATIETSDNRGNSATQNDSNQGIYFPNNQNQAQVYVTSQFLSYPRNDRNIPDNRMPPRPPFEENSFHEGRPPPPPPPNDWNHNIRPPPPPPHHWNYDIGPPPPPRNWDHDRRPPPPPPPPHDRYHDRRSPPPPRDWDHDKRPPPPPHDWNHDRGPPPPPRNWDHDTGPPPPPHEWNHDRRPPPHEWNHDRRPPPPPHEWNHDRRPPPPPPHDWNHDRRPPPPPRDWDHDREPPPPPHDWDYERRAPGPPPRDHDRKPPPPPLHDWNHDSGPPQPTPFHGRDYDSNPPPPHPPHNGRSRFPPAYDRRPLSSQSFPHHQQETSPQSLYNERPSPPPSDEDGNLSFRQYGIHTESVPQMQSYSNVYANNNLKPTDNTNSNIENLSQISARFGNGIQYNNSEPVQNTIRPAVYKEGRDVSLIYNNDNDDSNLSQEVTHSVLPPLFQVVPVTPEI